MADKWQSTQVVFEGGLRLNQDPLTLGSTMPGAASISINYEPSLVGGYRRVNGFAKYDSTVVPGEGAVLGVFVYGDKVLAARKAVGLSEIKLYAGTGAGWGSAINSATLSSTNVTKVRGHAYRWTTSRIVFVDGVNYASKWDGSTWTTLNGAGAPTNPSLVTTYRQHLVLSGYSSNPNAITIGEPNNDIGFSGAADAIEIVVGDKVVGLKTFRETLYIFCQNSIYKLEGASTDDYVLSPVTRNIGCISSDSIQEVGGDLMFLAPDGIRPISATDRIGDVELSTVSREVWDYLSQLIQDRDPAAFCSTVVRAKTQYRLFASISADTTANSPGLLGGLRNGAQGLAWEWHKLKGFAVSCADSGWISDAEITVHGDHSGYVFEQEEGNSFDGGNVFSQLRTPHMPFQDINIRKTLYKMSLYYKIEGVTAVTLGTILDYGRPTVLQPLSVEFGTLEGVAIYGAAESTYGTATYGAAAFPVGDQYLIGSGFTFAFDFTTDDINPPHTLQSFSLEFSVAGRR